MRIGLLVIVLLLPCAAQAQTIANAGLEEGRDAPAGWAWATGEGGKGSFEWVTVPTHSGLRAIRSVHSNAAGYTLIDGGLVDVRPGADYTISAWVRSSRNSRHGVYFMISQLRADTGAVDYPNTFGRRDAALAADRWQPLTVHVTVRPGNTRLRIQCIQAMGPTDICWDDFAINEASSEPALRFEPPVKEALPDLAPAQAILARRPRARATVDRRSGRPRLVVDGKRMPWTFMVGPFYNTSDVQVKDFRDAGVRVYLVPLMLGRGIYGSRGPWLGKDRYDFSEVDDLLWRVLRVDPNGYVIFYMACDPYREWGAENFDDVTWDQQGRKAIVDMHPRRWGDDPRPDERFGPSLVSQKLRADTAETLRRLVKHVEGSLPGKAVIGYHVAGSNDGQWFQWCSYDTADPHLADYSPGAVASYREWLRRRYRNDVGALRKAWNRPDAAFDTAVVPPMDRLWADGAILDPATHQDVADYTRFFSEGVAETVDFLAATLKRATRRSIVCGTYYEDITCNSANHIALARHLASDAIDYLAGPAAYGVRMPGYQGAVRSVFASTLLHGKMYLTEQDWRSWHAPPNAPQENFEWGRAESAEAHNAMVRRECGMMLALGLGTWWYDMSGGWFRDDGIMAGIAEAIRAFGRDLTVDEMPTADLAVFASEESNDYIAPKAGGTYRYLGVVGQIEELNTAGVPYRLYLQSDLGKKKLPDHKAYLFLNPYVLTPLQRAAIERLKRQGKLLIFVHAPGVVGATDPAKTISEITGMTVRRATGVTRLLAEPVETPHTSPIGAVLDCLSVTLPSSAEGPAYEVADSRVTSLACYMGSAQVAVGARDFGRWKSVFVGCPGLTAEFLSRLAAWAGCRRAAEPGDAVYASDRFATIHAIFPGRKVLRLRRPARVTDLTSGNVVSENATTIELDMERGQTRWFWLDPVGGRK